MKTQIWTVVQILSMQALVSGLIFCATSSAKAAELVCKVPSFQRIFEHENLIEPEASVAVPFAPGAFGTLQATAVVGFGAYVVEVVGVSADTSGKMETHSADVTIYEKKESGEEKVLAFQHIGETQKGFGTYPAVSLMNSEFLTGMRNNKGAGPNDLVKNQLLPEGTFWTASVECEVIAEAP